MDEQKDIIRVRKLIELYKGQLQGRRMLCKNFGQSCVTMLEDEFTDYRYGSNLVWSSIREFDNWCKSAIAGAQIAPSSK